MSAVPEPRSFRLAYWSPKRSAILIGFILTVLGSLGSQFYVEPVAAAASAHDQLQKDLGAKIDAIRVAKSQYILFQQQGALIQALYAAGLAAEGGAQRDVLGNLSQLSLLNQSSALRPMLGELALAHVIDYRVTSDRYNALIATARKSFGVASFAAVDEFEKSILAQGDALTARLLQNYGAAGAAKSAADASAERRRLQLLALLTLGSAVLLAANLMSTRQERAAAAL